MNVVIAFGASCECYRTSRLMYGMWTINAPLTARRGHHDVFLVSWVFLEAAMRACGKTAAACSCGRVIALDVRDRGPFDLDLEIAVERGSGRNVREREARPRRGNPAGTG